MPELHQPQIRVAAETGATPWAYGKPHDYAHDVAGKAREAEVRDRLAAVRAKLRGEPLSPSAAAPSPAERCEDCGYLTTAPGHLAECGEPA